MKVKECMSKKPVTATMDTTVPEAFQLMKDKNIRRLPVLEHNKLVGIVTVKDLGEVAPSKATTLSIFEINYLLAKTTLREVVDKSRKVITISPDANMEKAALVMRENKIGGIPVVDGDKLVGIITETDIFDSFIEILGVNRRGTRIDLELSDEIGSVAKITKLMADMGLNIQNLVVIPREGSKTAELILRLETLESEKVVRILKEEGYHVIEAITKNY
ncbi:MAG: CBS and ACT domain-containing protein [Solirubrobacterales bacterium]